MRWRSTELGKVVSFSLKVRVARCQRDVSVDEPESTKKHKSRKIPRFYVWTLAHQIKYKQQITIKATANAVSREIMGQIICFAKLFRECQVLVWKLVHISVHGKFWYGVEDHGRHFKRSVHRFRRSIFFVVLYIYVAKTTYFSATLLAGAALPSYCEIQ